MSFSSSCCVSTKGLTPKPNTSSAPSKLRQQGATVDSIRFPPAAKLDNDLLDMTDESSVVNSSLSACESSAIDSSLLPDSIKSIAYCAAACSASAATRGGNLHPKKSGRGNITFSMKGCTGISNPSIFSSAISSSSTTTDSFIVVSPSLSSA